MLPTSTKRFSIIPIPKSGNIHIRRPISLLDNLEAFVTIHISKHLSDGLKITYKLPPCITTYHKGKSIDEIIIAHLLTHEDINQSVHCILGIISDDEEKFFVRISLEFLCTTLIQYIYSNRDSLNGRSNPSPAPPHVSPQPKTSSSSTSNAVPDKAAPPPVISATPSPLSKLDPLPTYHHNHNFH